MKNLLALLVILLLLPFMAVGFVFEVAGFGFACGRDAGMDLFKFAFKKGGTQ